MNEWLRWLRFWARWLLFCEANICMNCDVNSWGARSVWIKKCVLMNVICPIQRSLKLDLPISSIPSVQDPPPYRGLYRRGAAARPRQIREPRVVRCRWGDGHRRVEQAVHHSAGSLDGRAMAIQGFIVLYFWIQLPTSDLAVLPHTFFGQKNSNSKKRLHSVIRHHTPR